MSARSRLLELDRVEPGMILSEALLDTKGEVLLPEGATLTEAMLGALQRRGVDYLAVNCDEEADEVTGADKQAQLERMRERMDKLFRRCGQGGACGHILTCIMRYRAG